MLSSSKYKSATGWLHVGLRITTSVTKYTRIISADSAYRLWVQKVLIKTEIDMFLYLHLLCSVGGWHYNPGCLAVGSFWHCGLSLSIIQRVKVLTHTKKISGLLHEKRPQSGIIPTTLRMKMFLSIYILSTWCTNKMQPNKKTSSTFLSSYLGRQKPKGLDAFVCTSFWENE